MPGIGVISNPNARFNKLNPGMKDRLNFILGKGGEVTSTGTLDDVATAAKAFADCQIDLVAISGGDGTAQRTLEVLISAYGDRKLPPILLLPTGTMNMVPASFGIHGNGLSVFLRIVARYRHNLPIYAVKRNLLHVNQHYSFMFGLGMPARFLKDYEDAGKHTFIDGAKLLGSYVLDAFHKEHVRLDRAFRCVQMKLRYDEGEIETRSNHTLFASFIEELALHFRCFPRAGLDRNLFEILEATGPAPWSGFALPHFLCGSTRPMRGFRRKLARSLTVQLETPELYTLDGEIYPALDHFTIEPGPELEFIVLHRPKSDRGVEIGPFGMQYFV